MIFCHFLFFYHKKIKLSKFLYFSAKKLSEHIKEIASGVRLLQLRESLNRVDALSTSQFARARGVRQQFYFYFYHRGPFFPFPISSFLLSWFFFLARFLYLAFFFRFPIFFLSLFFLLLFLIAFCCQIIALNLNTCLSYNRILVLLHLSTP